MHNEDTEGGTTGGFGNSLFVLGGVLSVAQAGRAVIDAGLKSMSMESGLPELIDMPGARYAGASDEHGTLRTGQGNSPALGDRVRVIPVTATRRSICMTGLFVSGPVWSKTYGRSQPAAPYSRSTRMQDRPTIDELLDAVEIFLRETAVDRLEGQPKFHARVAANAVSIVRRELALEAQMGDAEAESWELSRRCQEAGRK